MSVFPEKHINIPRPAFVAVAIFVLSLFSFDSNFLSVVSDDYFEKHQIDSEQFVLDGILHSRISNDHMMGKFSRNSQFGDELFLRARAYYNTGDITGDFLEYKSQFGLQFYFFRFLSEHINSDIAFLEWVAALLMAMVVSTFYIGMAREYSPGAALLFSLTLVLSPLITAFARNLYWVEFTWFLPALTALLLGRGAMISVPGLMLETVLLFFAFLIKFLCGYEYATVVVLAACTFILGHAVRNGFEFRRLAVHISMCAAASLLAFSLAIAIHVRSIEPDPLTGLADIMTTAKKRLTSQLTDPAFVADLCSKEKDPIAHDACVADYTTSLNANPIKVVAKYFLMLRFLPWSDFITLDRAEKDKIKAFLANPTLSSFVNTASKRVVAAYFLFSLNIGAFLLFNFAVFYKIIRNRSDLSLLTTAAFIASVSWFIAAKGHSAQHYHINYVLWYLPYIPFGVILLLSPRESEVTQRK